MSQMSSHQDNLVDILRRIEILRKGVKAIHGSKELIQFMEVALGVGNYIGAKRKMGHDLRPAKPKFGVQFDGIFHFEETRSNSHRRNLMQALVQSFVQLVGEDKARFHEELTEVVREASRLKPEVLDNDVQSLRDSLVKAVRTTSTALSNLGVSRMWMLGGRSEQPSRRSPGQGWGSSTITMRRSSSCHDNPDLLTPLPMGQG